MSNAAINLAMKSACAAFVGDTSQGWHDLASIWRARLSSSERMRLALVALRACDPDDLADIVNDLSRPTLPSSMGEAAREYRKANPVDCAPVKIPHFDDPNFLAKLSGEHAPIAERKRYMVRAWHSLSHNDRNAFIDRFATPSDLRRVA